VDWQAVRPWEGTGWGCLEGGALNTIAPEIQILPGRFTNPGYLKT
jgi:hypothetical protein